MKTIIWDVTIPFLSKPSIFIDKNDYSWDILEGSVFDHNKNTLNFYTWKKNESSIQNKH